MVATARMVEQGMVVLLVLTSPNALSEPLGAGARPVHSIRDRSQQVKDALSGVTVLLHHYAEVHRALQVPHDRDRVDAAEYLRKICLSIRRSKLERAQVHLVLAAPPLVLQSAECWLLGLIVYELITNAVRHAFHGRNGEI